MARMGRLGAALVVPLVLAAAPAEAHVSPWALAAPIEAALVIVPARPGPPGSWMPRGELREIVRAPRSGLVATLPVAGNLDIGVGRFAVPQLAGRRTNMEPVRRPTDVRRRDRGIAAVGFSFSF